MLSTILRNPWERGRVNMIFSEDLAVDVNYFMKQFSPPYVNPIFSTIIAKDAS